MYHGFSNWCQYYSAIECNIMIDTSMNMVCSVSCVISINIECDQGNHIINSEPFCLVYDPLKKMVTSKQFCLEYNITNNCISIILMYSKQFYLEYDTLKKF